MSCLRCCCVDTSLQESMFKPGVRCAGLESSVKVDRYAARCQEYLRRNASMHPLQTLSHAIVGPFRRSVF